jgi:hypothetical protein
MFILPLVLGLWLVKRVYMMKCRQAEHGPEVRYKEQTGTQKVVNTFERETEDAEDRHCKTSKG